MSENLLAQKNQVSSKSYRKVLFVMSLLLVLVAGVLLYIFVYKVNTDTEKVVTSVNPQNEKDAENLRNLYKNEGAPVVEQKSGSSTNILSLNDTSTNTEGLKGRLIFSGVMPERENRANYVQIHSLDMSSSSANTGALFPELGFSAVPEYFNSQAEPVQLFYVGTTSEASEADQLAVYSYDQATKARTAYANTKGVYERNLAWSDKAELLAYNSFVQGDKKYVNLIPIESWEVIIFDPKTNTVVDRVQEAYFPHWSPSGTQLLFYKKDGLYLYTLENKEAKKVVSVPADNLVTTTSMSDLSQDGMYFIWTTAKKGVVTLYKIHSWNTFEITEIGRHSKPFTEYYWPVFSPDSKYYVVQGIDTLKPEENFRKNPRIEVRRLLGTKVVRKYSLDGFNFDQLFTDAWLK